MPTHHNEIHFSAIRALLLSAAFPKLRLLGLGANPLEPAEVQALRAEFGHRVEIGFPVPRRRGPVEIKTPAAEVIPLSRNTPCA
jgi:hypothetical protein